MDFSEEAYEKRRAEILGTGVSGSFIPPYSDLAKMPDDTRRYRQLVVEQDPFLYHLLDFDDATVRQYLEISLALCEAEDAISTISRAIPQIGVAEGSLKLAKKSRELRKAVNQIVSSAIVSRVSFGKFDVENIGIHASAGENYLEFDFPFEAIAMSTLHILNLKKIVSIEQLMNEGQAWADLMAETISRIPMQYRERLPKSRIVVHVLTNKRRMSDPDHFWMRPVIDSFVNCGIISDDNPITCEFRVHYQFGYKESYLNIQVGRQIVGDYPMPRNENLLKFF